MCPFRLYESWEISWVAKQILLHEICFTFCGTCFLLSRGKCPSPLERVITYWQWHSFLHYNWRQVVLYLPQVRIGLLGVSCILAVETCETFEHFMSHSLVVFCRDITRQRVCSASKTTADVHKQFIAQCNVAVTQLLTCGHIKVNTNKLLLWIRNLYGKCTVQYFGAYYTKLID